MTKMYPDFEEGQEASIDWEKQDFLFCCCDCHLVHRLRFRVEGNRVYFAAWRENVRTSAVRRYRGIPIVVKKAR